MVIPNSNGYTLFYTDTSDMSYYTSKLLFQHKSKNYYHLFDRLMTVCPDLKELVGYIKKVSMSWFNRFKGRTITFMLKAFMTFAVSPQHYGHYADYLFSANYTKLRHYFQRLIKMMKKLYNIPDRKYKFEIKKDVLFYISKVFAHEMLDDMVALVPRYNMLMAKQTSI